MHKHITFIGGGNMAASLIGGLLQDGHPAERIAVVEPVEERRQWLSREFQIECQAETNLSNTDVVVLAVKPQVLQTVAKNLAVAIQQNNVLVVSIAAGIRCEDMARWLGGHRSIVRCMPNTPALVQTGATGLYALDEVSSEQRRTAESVLRAVGLTLWVEEESLIDSITAISGSGPAYFFHFMEALQAAGQKLGLEPQKARLLTLQTALGAARMALESKEDLAELRRRVTSPGGTTERALQSMDAENFVDIVGRAAAAAAQRAAELADDLGADQTGDE
ncbi:MAG: pyrroline-5-carboxylate reductase [Salinisphaeraceae bacterium]|nr:pyrroline-5-carboxylate reductase [Salinisphaeraceae bacterium]